VTSWDARALFALYGGMHGRAAPVMVALTILGAGWMVVWLVPLIWFGRTRGAGVALALAIGVQATLVWALKAAVGRVRPWMALGLPAPIGHPDDGSFPSGHAAGSFCVATFLAVLLPAVWRDSRGRAHRVALGVALAALVLATSIALSRVYLGAHFPSDVLGGALLGAVVGAAAAKMYLARG
jgi:undecaprenyl-diphosphatase